MCDRDMCLLYFQLRKKRTGKKCGPALSDGVIMLPVSAEIFTDAGLK